MSMERWEPYFKPEVRSAGRTLASKGVVNLSRGSDTEVQGYIRASTPAKVTFRTAAIDSESFSISCNCPPAKKGQKCKHMWAALMELEEKNPDFLEAKTEIVDSDDISDTPAQPKPISESQTAYKAKREEYEATQKEKQATYRKEQYQRQKQRLNEKKGKVSKKNTPPAQQFPDEIEEALQYFHENGFELRDSMDPESISNARKKLARVFHPDKGGNHDEILELNRYTDILLEYSMS